MTKDESRIRSFETPKTGNFGKSKLSVAGLVKEHNLLIDVCCTTKNRVTECPAFFAYDKGLNALSQKWILNCWMNPPYGDQETWVKKAISQVIEHKIKVVSLLRVDTSIIYFRKWVMKIDDDGLPVDIGCNVEFTPIAGRIKYWEDGIPLPPAARPPFASAIVIWTPRPKTIDLASNHDDFMKWALGEKYD